MNAIGFRVFLLSLTRDAAICFNELPYKSIYAWDQLGYGFPVRLFPISKNLNKKNKLKNFVAQQRESVSGSWD